MKKFIPLELSLAERLVAAQLENPFCGFCRTERAAVEELKAAIAKPSAQLWFSPSLAYLEELEKKQGFGTIDGCDEGGLERLAISQMPGPARQPVDYDELQRLISEVHASPGECTWDELDKAAGSAIEDILLDRYQLQATIKEMGELIDQQAAELAAARNVLTEIRNGVRHHGWVVGCTVPGQIDELLPRETV